MNSVIQPGKQLQEALDLNVEKLVYGGDGLARLPADEHGRGKAVFLPFVLEGERVQAVLTEQERGFSRARAEKILESSVQRIDPACPYFQRCGGCHYQHANYQHQLEIKAAILKENLRRIARLELETEPVIHPSPEWNYRNRTRLKVQTAPEFAIGYYRFRSHQLLPVEICPISSPLLNRVIEVLWEMGRAGNFAAEIREIELFANADDSELLIEAYCAPEMPEASAEAWAAHAHKIGGVAGVVVFKLATGRSSVPETPAGAAGSPQLTYQTEKASYRVSAGSFFQVNRFLTDKLVEIVTSGRSGDTALDLYAGVGLFSSVLSREFARVIAVESSPTSHADLLYNSPIGVKAAHSTAEQYLRNAN
ncbi:MAG: class I SAM-dependent RNA methyltransferase, partial [Acidobacteriales bacterium]|nr:class I SAM-dependent RNA methyltransferase [Terriglobales bacterium]